MSSHNFVYQERQWVGAGRQDCVAKKGMVASKHPLIGKVGLKMLKKGGNAVDAAVASAFVDCVVEPAMNGIGGEGVMAIHLTSGENVIIDYVGRPVQGCHAEMFELVEGYEKTGWMWRNVKDKANQVGYKACTTPGMVAGLTLALERYGTMSLREVMAPAIKIAEEGFVVGWWTASHIFQRMRLFWSFSEWRRIYLHEGQFPYTPYRRGIEKPES